MSNLNEWEKKWLDPNVALQTCWSVGQKKGKEDLDLAERVSRGELPVLPWKGGIEKATKKGWKYGVLNYLAMWQGIKNVPLDVAWGEEYELTCTRTGMKVIYTSDFEKYKNA
ncbi:hypothetical protein [Aestuariibacter salexigens]|uniref:hypothetical protein n=1 Tax=Aestuariibacter salexigens TaxID=226010 RepID=UPI00040C29A2|nr:hypothetical protein [Aestuariibacter salexigens]